MAESGGVTLEVGGRPVVVTHPDRAVFPPHDDRPAITKLDLVRASDDPQAVRQGHR